jgi:shikimate dehydrogenase
VWALTRAGAAEVRVWNRHPDRAQALVDELGGVPVQTAAAADLLVNCTPVGMNGDVAEFKQLPLQADEIAMYTCVVDLVYSHADTPLVAAAKARGVPVVDGLDLLVGQGALSFERFTGLPAPVDVMRAAARREAS